MQIVISLLFYDAKLKSPGSPLLTIFGPLDFDTIVDTLLIITQLLMDH